MRIRLSSNCQACKHENLNSNPKHPQGKLGVVLFSCNVGTMEADSPMFTGQLAWLNWWALVQWEILSPKLSQNAKAPDADLWPPHSCAQYTQNYKQTKLHPKFLNCELRFLAIKANSLEGTLILSSAVFSSGFIALEHVTETTLGFVHWLTALTLTENFLLYNAVIFKAKIILVTALQTRERKAKEHSWVAQLGGTSCPVSCSFAPLLYKAPHGNRDLNRADSFSMNMKIISTSSRVILTVQRLHVKNSGFHSVLQQVLLCPLVDTGWHSGEKTEPIAAQ